MSKIISESDYKIIIAYLADNNPTAETNALLKLEEEVNNYLHNGYVVVGSPQKMTNGFYQAVIIREKLEKKTYKI